MSGRDGGDRTNPVLEGWEERWRVRNFAVLSPRMQTTLRAMAGYESGNLPRRHGRVLRFCRGIV
jgi:hypothetical protein